MQHYFRVGKLSHSNKFQQVSIKESSSGFTFSLSLFGIDEALLLHHSYDVIHLFRMFTNVNGPKDCIEMAILTIIDLLLSHSSMFFFLFLKYGLSFSMRRVELPIHVQNTSTIFDLALIQYLKIIYLHLSCQVL